MYAGREQVARSMAAGDDATAENLVSDIVGELAGLIEIEEILDQSGLADVERSEERVEEALRRARESSEMQRILFQHAVSYDANELQSSFAMGLAHLRAFVFGMLTAAGGSVRDKIGRAPCRERVGPYV